METQKEEQVPGAATTYIDRGKKGFSKIEMLLDATGGLSLSQVCVVTGLESSTIQNWVKRGWVAHPKGKRYEEIHIARILIINALKECIKLEHIALLMSYVNGSSEVDDDDVIIRESELYSFLCDALAKMGQTDDLSRGGVESVVDSVIITYEGPKPDSRVRIRKALSLMIYACVCTDVKRRTEAMMKQILIDLEHPEKVDAEAAAEAVAAGETTGVEGGAPGAENIEAPRKTVIQALREWDTADISSVERVIIGSDEESIVKTAFENEEKHSYRPWYARKGAKH